MFYEVKPYQTIRLEDVVGFSMFPGGENGGRILYVYLRGVRDSFRFGFDTESECRYAYRRLRKALIDAGNEMEDFNDGSYLY